MVHDRSRCVFGIDGFTALKQGLQDTYTWAAGPDLPAQLQSAQEFKAEILEPGMPESLPARVAPLTTCGLGTHERECVFHQTQLVEFLRESAVSSLS